MSIFVLLGAISFLNERLNELVIHPLINAIAPSRLNELKGMLALLTGILITWLIGLDIFTPLANEVDLSPEKWAAVIVTGLLVGLGSSVIHDFVELLTGAKLFVNK